MTSLPISIRRAARVIAGAMLLASVIGAAAPACAHQVNISTARVEVRPQRTVAVEVALKGSDVDRVAGTHVFDEQTGTVDAAKVAAAAAQIAAYVGAHVSVTGADGAPCVAGAPEVTADGDGVITRNTFSCAKVAGDLVYHSTVLTASNSSARQPRHHPHAAICPCGAWRPEPSSCRQCGGGRFTARCR